MIFLEQTNENKWSLIKYDRFPHEKLCHLYQQLLHYSQFIILLSDYSQYNRILSRIFKLQGIHCNDV